MAVLKSLPLMTVLAVLVTFGGVRAQDQPDSIFGVDTENTTNPTPPTDSTTPNASGPVGGGRVGPDYVLGPEDVLTIEIFQLPELTKTVRVANDGTVALPLIGNVQAAGMNTAQFRKELEQKYGDSYLQDPQVTIYVKEFHAQQVSVNGPVAKPGLYSLPGSRTLIDVISMAGGLASRSNGAAGKTVEITRKDGFSDLPDADGLRQVSPDTIEIDLNKLYYSHQPELNVQIKPFDVINVSKADIVYVVGAVKKPGGFVVEDREHITIMQALALAEGFSGMPNKTKSMIIRRDLEGNKTVIPVNVGRIMKGRTEDVQLAANDILYIPDSTTKDITRRSIDSAVGMLTWLVIYHGL